MSTFDEIVPTLTDIFRENGAALDRLIPLLINRDLNGRVRLVVEEGKEADTEARTALATITEAVHWRLGRHAVPIDRMVLFEPSLDSIRNEAPHFPLEGVEGVDVVDRLATEGDWATITEPGSGAPRIVFFSIKGGVGRSTAMAAAAWALAESGRRVLVLDMDLESPGLSSSILPADRRPKFGITDWLVEDLVDNGDAVLGDMVATSQLSHNGDIHVVPAHGVDPGEYIAKLGRAWMPKPTADGRREPWAQRLQRLIGALEARLKPDVVLIDSRAGIDEVASACVTDLGATCVLLFAIDGEQTWSGYRVLFRHWRRAGIARDIRERLQVVGAMIPETGTQEYYACLVESAWNAFSEELYDEVPAGELATGDGFWNFDLGDETGPHHPWPILWNRGFAAMRSLHHRLEGIDAAQVQPVFGGLLTGLDELLDGGEGWV